MRFVAVRYSDFPAIEWTPYFKNTGKTASSLIADIRALDARFERTAPGEFLLDHAKGSPTEASSYEPRSTALGKKARKFELATSGGRSSDSTMPYWKLNWGNAGVVTAVGWPGQWAADFETIGDKALRVRAGQETTHFRLEPGEEVRAPLIALVFWQGDEFRAHNLWREWVLAHNLPRVDGKLPPTQLVACGSHQFKEMIEANEDNQKHMIDRYVAERLPIRYWWMDAGWYLNDGNWTNTGTWEVDKKRFPNGLRAITDHGRTKGVKSIVWFEPERVTTNSWLFENHPEWCLEAKKLPEKLAYQAKWRLLNLGNPETWHWLVEHIDKIITDEGIDLYRQDFNMDPLAFWQAQDAPDRQGITEIRYVTGYLAYWDELRRRHPAMLIDSCASGGRRNDLETVRRSLPLLREDYLFDPVAQQAHTHGLSRWLPYHGTGTRFIPTMVSPTAASEKPVEKVDTYLFRSHMAPSLNACWDVRRGDLDYEALRSVTQQFERVSPYYLGDYYPLTSYSLGKDVWMAWQFHRPDLGEGMVQVFRRDESPYESACFKLHGLDATANYEVENLDGGKELRTGAELMEQGLTVTVKTQPAALVFAYKRVIVAAERGPYEDKVSSAADTGACQAWTKSFWNAEDPARWPISFSIEGKPSSAFLTGWSALPPEHRADGGKETTVLRRRDPATGLELRVEINTYQNWPAVEWTAFLENDGGQHSPELRGLQAADVFFKGSEFTLHGIEGDSCSSKSFAPYEWQAKPGMARIFGPGPSGKSTNGPDGWPYFNLAGPGNEGRILILGWPGNWSATFSAENGGMRWQGGQERSDLRLKPGEKVRFPSATMLFWKGGDWEIAQNLWRRWYREEVMPHPAGGRQKSVWQEQTLLSESQIPRFKRLLDAGIKTDICWMDAGAGWWLKPEPRPFPESEALWLNTTGLWEPDPVTFPKGFAPFGDWARQNGMKTLLWFEPERIAYANSAPGAYDRPVFATEHPDWLLPGGSHGSYFNLGNPAALSWLEDHLSTIIERQKLDWYREDYNGDGPYKVWRENDEVEKGKTGLPRAGLTENFYIQGHLALWDTLRARKPGLLLDSCASGGRRNDLESMRRAVPLLRSDYEMTKDADKFEGFQGQTYGLSYWLPFYGGLSRFHEPYGYRSLYMPSFGMIAPLAITKRAYAEFRTVAPHMIEGDYYTLTPYNRATDQWIAWQFHTPGTGGGVIQAFRRSEAANETLTVKLRGLDDNTTYEIENLDGGKQTRTGAELMRGLDITLREKPAAAVIVLKALK